MTRTRLTNNSAATLEDQTLIIHMMSEKANKSNTPALPAKEQEKKEKDRRKKSQTEVAPKPSGSGQRGNNVAIPTKTQSRKENNVAKRQVDELERAPGSDSEPESEDVQRDEGIPISTQQQQPIQQLLQPQPMPLYYPQPFPNASQGAPPYFPQQLGHYAGFGAAMGPPLQAMAGDWNLSHGPEHDLSDEDSEGESVASIQTVQSNQSVQLGRNAERSQEIDFSTLKKGKLAERLKSQHLKATETEKLAPPTNETLAQILDGFCDETKVAGELEKLTKDYPRVKNLERLVVPKLESELFTAVEQSTRMTDLALQNLQKGLVAAISAMVPIANLHLERGETDKALDNLGDNIFDAIHLIALTNNGITNRRKEIIKPVMQVHYARALAKNQGGSPQWLFGGNLSEATRKCEAEKRVADKLVKRKNTSQQAPHNNNNNGNQNHKAGGQKQQKRYKYNNNAAWQGQQQNGQKTFGYQYPQQAYQSFQQYGQPQYYPQQWPQQTQQQPQQQQAYKPRQQKQQQPQGGQNSNPDFQKRGPRF